MAQQTASGSSASAGDTLRARILRSPSPLRPTATKAPDHVKAMPVTQTESSNVSDRLALVNNEMSELKQMYSKVVEAQEGLQAELRASEEQRKTAEMRAEAAERALAARGAAALLDTVRSQREIEVMWRVVAETVDAQVLDSLRKLDAEANAAAAAELERLERQRCITLWTALRESVDAATFQAVARSVNGGVCPRTSSLVQRSAEPMALPVSIARRLFDASDGAKSGKGAPSLLGSEAPAQASVEAPVEAPAVTQADVPAEESAETPAKALLAGADADSDMACHAAMQGQHWALASPLREGEQENSGHLQRPDSDLQQELRGESTPRQLGGRRASVAAPFAGTFRAEQGLSSAQDAAERRATRASTGGCAGATPKKSSNSGACTGAPAVDPTRTPARTFPGGVVVATPHSASVRDRIRALEAIEQK